MQHTLTEYNQALMECGVGLSAYQGTDLTVNSPIDGAELEQLRMDDTAAIEQRIGRAYDAFAAWRDVPAPKRGELIRVFGNVLREVKEPLSRLVSIECGKILTEARGEVQEMIDVCDFAVGLSRQLHGLTIVSERPEHVMQETWYPLGVVGIISAFNFPVAVWAWNLAIAVVCGNTCVWKPSEKTPIVALVCQQLFERACEEVGEVPEGISSVVIGERSAGEQLVDDERVALVSATGSCAMGRIVGERVAKRFGKSLLELGGNNAAIITPNADLNVALPSIVFGATGTAGQRCTSTRRVFVHRSIIDDVTARIKTAYEGLIANKIGSPLDDGSLIGPLIDTQSFDQMQAALESAKAQQGVVHFGERVEAVDGGYYVQPALVELAEQTDIALQETFAPIVYVMPYDELTDAVAVNNAAEQGLSSAIFTTDIREAIYFKEHSDCGITNINIGTSGAEIGGAFGGEKSTGGGRESGSDAWKQYMRRQTSTTYYGIDAPALAQGVCFELD